jgi:hypothetical protein
MPVRHRPFHWQALALHAVAIAVVSLLVRLVQPVVDACISGLETSSVTAWNLSLWLGQLGITLGIYLVLVIVGAFGTTVSRRGSFILLQQLSLFLIGLSWIIALHLRILFVGGADAAPSAALDLELLLVASLVAVLSPVCFQLKFSVTNLWRLFLLSLAIFYVALIAFEPDQLLIRLVHIGLVDPPVDWVLRSSFLGPLRYLAPIAPVLLSSRNATEAG